MEKDSVRAFHKEVRKDLKDLKDLVTNLELVKETFTLSEITDLSDSFYLVASDQKKTEKDKQSDLKELQGIMKYINSLLKIRLQGVLDQAKVLMYKLTTTSESSDNCQICFRKSHITTDCRYYRRSEKFFQHQYNQLMLSTELSKPIEKDSVNLDEEIHRWRVRNESHLKHSTKCCKK